MVKLRRKTVPHASEELSRTFALSKERTVQKIVDYRSRLTNEIGNQNFYDLIFMESLILAQNERWRHA